MKRRIEKIVAKIEIVTENPADGSLKEHRERLHGTYPRYLISTALESMIPASNVDVEIEYADCWDVEGEAQ